ncbi:MAG: glycosyl hydrolase-related protein [Treponema sp.]|jgi:alpha-mannosidase|nr:glycosyl hydrolase-related protein [Treponema sp.]
MLIPKIEQRISQYLHFLKAERYREIEKLNFETMSTEKSIHRPADIPPQPWDKISCPWEYGRAWHCYWFHSRFIIPAGSRYPLYLRIVPNADSLLFLDGNPLGAFNPAHKKVKVPPALIDGKVHSLYLEAYAGHHYPGCHPFEGGKILFTLQRQIPAYPNIFEGGDLVERIEPVYGLYYDAACLFDLAKTLPANSLRKARILKGLYDALMKLRFDSRGETLEREAALASEELVPLLQARNGPTVPEIHLIGHAHIDHAWLWHIAETERKVARTYINMIRLAEEYPDFVFIQTQPAQLEIVKRDYPEIFDAVKEAYHKGNWDPNGGMWVEADCNISGGESLVRQFLVGKRANWEMLGCEADTLWLPDVFGYAAALPQILAGCGIKYFVTSKINWNDTTRFPYDTFIWRGIDGTGIKTHYISSRLRGYNGKVGPEFLAEIWDQIQHKEIQDQAINSVGEGDGGGGTVRGDLEMAKRLADLEGAPRAKWNKVSPALDSIFGPEGVLNWPEWRGELYLELHRGTYTSQARTKRWNRRLEFALRHTEALFSIASLKGWASYPHEELLKNWKVLLTNQFHDIIPGSSINRVYQEAEEAYKGIEDSLAAITASLQKTVHAKGPGEPVLTLFNSLSWGREDPVFVPASLLGPHLRGLRPAGGDPNRDYHAGFSFDADMARADGNFSVQYFENIDGEETAVFFPKLPPLGWVHFVSGEDVGSPPFEYHGYALDTPFYYIRFDDSGTILGIRDKNQGRELVREGGRFNYFVSAQDLPVLWEAWDIDADWTAYLEKETRLQSTSIVTMGTECCILRRTYLTGKASTLTQDMITYTKNRRIDFVTRVDWHERRRLLKVCFDSSIDAAQIRCEVQYGHLLRNTHKNLPQDRAMFEICAHKWISLEEAGSGLALLNDCKYGHDVSGGNIRLTLLRSPTAPDPEADQGRHAFTYSLLPFEGSFAQSGVVRAAYELNAPLSWECGPGGKEKGEEKAKGEEEAPPAAVSLTGSPADASGWVETEPPGYSLLSIDNPAVILECLKAPELPFGLTKKKKDRALTLRLYESLGGHCRAAIHFNSTGENVPGKQISGAWETDMLERQKTNLHHAGNEISLEFRPFEIKTVLVEFWGNT